MVRYGKGDFSTGSSWTMDLSLLKGFQHSGSGHVRVLLVVCGGGGVEVEKLGSRHY